MKTDGNRSHGKQKRCGVARPIRLVKPPVWRFREAEHQSLRTSKGDRLQWFIDGTRVQVRHIAAHLTHAFQRQPGDPL